MSEFARNPLWFYLVIINLYLFGLMFYDKRQARKKGWRVPEANLLFLGLIGGGLGGLVAMQLFRHKTTKLKFKVCYGIGIVFAAGLIFFYRRGTL